MSTWISDAAHVDGDQDKLELIYLCKLDTSDHQNSVVYEKI